MRDQLYVYAIVGELVALSDLLGVAGEPLRVVSSGDCHAIAGTAATLPVLSADTLQAQDALVRALAARAAALLPARFGSTFDDETALRRALDDRAPHLTAALARVRGCEQMTIRLFGDPDGIRRKETEQDAQAQAQAQPQPQRQPQPQPTAEQEARAQAAAGCPATDPAAGLGPGTAYLVRRASAARRFPAAVDVLRARVADIVSAERVERGRPPLVASIHHLIPRGTAAAYHAAVQADAALRSSGSSGSSGSLGPSGESADDVATRLRIRISGPSPAYAFTSTETDLP